MDSTHKSPVPVYEFTPKVVAINTLRCRGSREGARVADVGKAGDVGEGSLEAGVRHHAVAAQIAPSLTLPACDRAVPGKLDGSW